MAERGTGCLSVLMALDEKATVLAVASGIIPTIISVMRKFGSELNIIQAASVILKRISLVKGEDSSYKLSQASSKIVDIATIFMKTFPENTLIIDSFLNTLVCCITENEAATKQALNQQSVNSVSAILSSMAKFPDKLSIQANGTTLLFSMSVDEQLMASILENGGLEIVVNNFKKPYSSNAVILENGIGCIWSLSSVETVRLELASPLNDTISLLIGLLTKNISNPGAQSKGNALLWNLAGTPQSRSKVIESGGIELINLNTAAHSNDASIMEYGRGALWALQQPPALDGAVLAKDTNDFDLKSPSKEFPAPSTLSNCMDGNHLNSASAPITDPIILLQSLHTEDSESIDFLLDILKRADNQATVDTCCNTLLNYTKSCEKNRAYLTARNAVPILTVCMKKFPDVASIQKNCTCALHNLAMIESNRTKNIIENEGIVLALTALKRFSDAPPVQESCLALLSILSSELQNKTAIASHSGLEIIVSTMEKYSNNPIILESSNVVLASMAEGSEDFCSVIVRCGAIALIASSAQQFPNSPGLQVSALSALTILASKSMQNKFTIAQVHGLEIGLNALQVSDVNVLERAISLLSHLVENVERNKQTIFKSHGVEMVIDVMKRFSNAQTIQHNGQLFLCNMLKHDKHG